MSQTLADKAYEAIKANIIVCELTPGQQVRQSELAKQNDIGMTPIREALQRLSREGLVQAIPRYGYVISSITLTDIHEIYELRAAVESFAAGLAATRGTDEQLRDINDLANFSYVHKDRNSYTEYLAHNHKFHCAIAFASGNQRLADLIPKLLDESTRLFHITIDLKDRADSMRDEHVQLAREIYNRDATRAEELARVQIASSKRRVLEAIMNPTNMSRLGIA